MQECSPGHQLAGLTLCTPLLQVEANDKPDLRLQGLAELHNVAEDAAMQHAMLLQSISYAKKADLANLLAPVIRVSCQLSCKVRQGVLTWWSPVRLRCCTRVVQCSWLAWIGRLTHKCCCVTLDGWP